MDCGPLEPLLAAALCQVQHQVHGGNEPRMYPRSVVFASELLVTVPMLRA